jgi:hypothetical protein
MKVFTYLDRISKMQKLLEQGCTGTPNEFACRLGVSRTSLYELLDELKSKGAPIVYSKTAKSFYYSSPYEISVSCILRPITYEEEKSHSGGNYLPEILFFRTLQSDLSMVTLPC